MGVTNQWTGWRPSPDLRTYLVEIDESESRGLPRGALVSLARKALTPAMRERAKVLITDLKAPASRKAIQRAQAEGKATHLNLGSGDQAVEGWLNIDLAGMGSDIAWNLKKGIPLPDGSVQAIFIEHVLEHIRIDDVFGLLDECNRVLAPGGIFRVSVPDFRKYAESYLGDGEFLESERPGRLTRLLAVHEVIYRHGHVTIWDGETMILSLAAAGFPGAAERKFMDSDLGDVPDAQLRAPESVYVEVRKAQ